MDALFGPLVVGYLFFGGMGAGACCVLASMVLLVPKDYYYVTSLKTSRKYPVGTCASTHEYRRLFGIGFTAAFVSLALGAAMLLADSGTQQVIVRLVSNPTLTFLSIGSFALAATLALSLLLAVCWGVAHSPLQYRFARITSWLLLAFGIVTALYTGLLLASMTAVPFWANIWLPVLFLTSSLSCGSALVLACGCLGGAILQFGTVFHRLLMLDLAVMSVELAIAVAFMAFSFSGPYEVAAQGAMMLIVGDLCGPFLFWFIGVGVVFPLAVELALTLRKAKLTAALLPVALAVFVGGFALRYCIVVAGAHPEVWTVIS